VSEQHDNRSPLALAYELSARITAVLLELVILVLAGYWLDRRWGTFPWLVLVGVVLGVITATLSLMRLAKSLNSGPPSSPKQDTARRKR
jgi:F0F1-type ATP synthase assembly protein I